MEHSWDIVIWTDENAIDYVPTSWGNEKKSKYKYPVGTNSLKIKKLIDGNVDLPEGQFIWLDALCKAEAVKDLQMAKDLCEKGMYTSNIETDEDGDSKRRRRRKVKALESDSESSDDHTPLARGQNLIRRKFSAPPMNTESLLESNSTPKSIIIGNSQCSFSPGTSTPISRQTQNLSGIGFGQVTLGSKEVSAAPGTSTPTSRQTQNFSDRQVTLGSKQVSADLTPILQELSEIQYYIKESKTILTRIENFMSTYNNKNNLVDDHATNTVSENINSSIVKKLPCQTKENLEEVDTMVKETIPMKELVMFLYLSGGDTPHKSVYMCMQKIFARELAVLYSGQGKKKKIPFCSMKTYEAVVAAVRKRHSSVTDESIKKSVSLFLATAKSRIINKQNGLNREIVLEEQNEEF